MTDPSSQDCAVRDAHLKFSMVYWGGALLSSIGFYIAKITDYSQYTWHGLYIAEKCVRYGSGWIVTTAISYTLLLLHRWASKRGPTERYLPVFIVSAFLMSLAGSPLWGAFGYVAQTVFPLPQQPAPSWNTFLNDTALGAALFFGWSCLFISLLFSFELHDRATRLAAAREEALNAQMRALRYQVNPHFLFNTLNSIACLIEEGEAGRAERMTLSLSTFLRTTLSLDPLNDVTLVEEVALQEDYLQIERERFSDRMTFTIDIASDVYRALVPSLILQPLIENAIKHGISSAVGTVSIGLRAWQENERLVLAIENDMPADGDAMKADGFGVGLRNVAERLNSRFHGDSSFTYGPVAPGRYRAQINVPCLLSAG